MTSPPVRAAAAVLISRLHAALAGVDGPIVIAVAGPAGSGRSGVLAEAATVVARTGRPLRRVDDADRLSAAEQAALAAHYAGVPVPAGTAVPAGGVPAPASAAPAAAAAPAPAPAAAPAPVAPEPANGVLLVGWTEPSRPNEALGALARQAGRQQLLARLGRLGEDELAPGVAALLDAPPDRALLEWLEDACAGQPWLVRCTVDALSAARLVNRGRFAGAAPSLEHEALATVLERVGAELAALPASCRPVLAAVVADSDPATLAEVAVAASEGWMQLCAAGLLDAAGVAPLVRAAAAAALGPAELAGGHQNAARLLARRGAPVRQRAEHAWAGRSSHPDAVGEFLTAGFDALGEDPDAALQWFDRAAATAGPQDPAALSARGARAQALVLAGRLPEAMETADHVLGRNGGEPHAAAAVAMAGARRNRWQDVANWSARVRGHHGVTDGWWTWQRAAALLVAGRLGELDAHVAGLDLTEALTPSVTRLREAVLVMRASLGTDRGELLAARRDARSSIGAQGLHHPPASAAVDPAELLAATALALGEPEGARQALSQPAPGPTASTSASPGSTASAALRRHALARWVVLRCGDTVRAIDGGDPNAPPEPIALAVNAALARRSGDVAATGSVARALPRVLAVLQVDLLNLDAVTELAIVARRFSPASVADEFDHAIDSFLAGVGSAPAWAARRHWASLESAIVSGRPGAVDAPAQALADISAILPGITVLADAASVWVQVLAGNPDPLRIDAAVRDLRTAGYVWEAAQLAGQAAIRVDDAALAKSLLGQARSLRGNAPQPSQPASLVGGGAGGGDGSVTPSGLSEREVEVARLVLNGLTHKAIGATLYISPKTVEHHVAHIRQKLGATNRAEFLAALREDLAALNE